MMKNIRNILSYDPRVLCVMPYYLSYVSLYSSERHFNGVVIVAIKTGILQLGLWKPMVDGVKCLCEVEVDKVHRPSNGLHVLPEG